MRDVFCRDACVRQVGQPHLSSSYRNDFNSLIYLILINFEIEVMLPSDLVF